MAKHNLECSDCGSKKALSSYNDGSTYCHKCLKLTPKEQVQEEVTATKSGVYDREVTVEEIDEFEERETFGHEVPALDKPPISNPRITPLASNFPALQDRSISHEAAAKYRVRAVLNDEIKNVRHVYPYFDREGNHVGNKCRTKFTKGFFVEGDLSKSALFGQQAFPSGGKSLTITEGELDALSVFQMFGHKYPVVSVKSASEAVKNIRDNYQYVNSFKEIVLCFDTDVAKEHPDGSVTHPGQDAAKEVAQLLPMGKVRIVTFQKGKDANEYLQKGYVSEFQKEWWGASVYTPVGIKHAKDMWEDVRKVPNYESVPFPWEGLQKLTYGLRSSELITITANPKVGKTSILREVVYDILREISKKDDDNRGIGLMFLEEPNRDTLLGLMSLTANKPLHLPDIREKVSDEELKMYFDSVYKNEKIVVWDHFGSNSIQKIIDYVRYMAALGCKYVILDHLSIIVSDQNGDERKQLDEVATKLKQLTIELNICIICVIHQNRKGEIRGTAGVEQLSNLVIKLYRDMLAEDEDERNTMKVSVEMNRFCGRTGPACLLRYVPDTGRLIELSKEEMQAYLDKTSKKKSDEDW